MRRRPLRLAHEGDGQGAEEEKGAGDYEHRGLHSADSLEYESTDCGGYYPSKFDAAKWVAAIKASGAKYICFTAVTTLRII